ncbi:MAG: hypothetical protein VR66_05815 [Peptococcaceae bacterium BRH_c23]|nr:MAG: hypothetical protein VR66_05815 [Peptococcaceae bacterium BRH_c23]
MIVAKRNNYDYATVINKALDARNSLSLSSYEQVDIFKILRDKENVSIILTEMKGDISGFFLRKEDICVIVINNKNTLGHQRFAAAHEYYHYKFNRGMTYKICPILKYDDEYEVEKEANIFASHFLMPDAALEYYLGKRVVRRELNISDLVFLENHFMISHKFTLNRIREINKKLNITDEDSLIEMEAGIIGQAKRLGYSTDIYKTTSGKGREIFSNYAELANELLEEKKISFGKYEQILLDGGYESSLFGSDEDNEEENML